MTTINKNNTNANTEKRNDVKAKKHDVEAIPNDNNSNNNNDSVSQTRLCIKNLPSSYTETDLRQYITDQYKKFIVNDKDSTNNDNNILKITDCRILRKQSDNKSRRIGFIGIESIIHSKLIQNKLNKAYCLTSKLIVEFAQLPKNTTTNTSKDNKDAIINKNKMNDKNQSTINDNNNIKNDKIEKKKQEFLAVMGVTDSLTKRKFWSNDDTNNNDKDVHQDEEDEEAQQLQTKTIKNNQSSISDSSSDSDDDDDNSVNDIVVNKDIVNKIETSKTNLNSNDDMDFFKSRQVQVIDLDEENIKVNNDNNENESSSSSDSDSEIEPMKTTEKKNTKSTKVEIVKDDDNNNNNNSNNSQKSKNTLTNTINNNIQNFNDNDNNNIIDNNDNIALNRIFLRNLPFSATEENIIEYLSKCGPIDECHIPIDDQKRNKGYAFITFQNNIDANNAIINYDGTDFQGRLLHIIPAKKAPLSLTNNNSNNNINMIDIDNDPNLTYKEKVERKRQLNALKNTSSWSTNFIRDDAVIDNLAIRLGIKKGDILKLKDNLSSGDAAVKLALGETAIIEENRKYFEQHGYNMEILVSFNNNNHNNNSSTSNIIKRSKLSILVKNLPYDTNKDELLKMFNSIGDEPNRILLPPSRTIAVIEYNHINDSKNAFKRLAYRKYKNVPLYLEWAPILSINNNNNENENNDSTNKDSNIENQNKDKNSDKQNINKNNESTTNSGSKENIEEIDDVVNDVTFSVYVKNLNFSTTEEQLLEYFSKYYQDVRAVRIPKKASTINTNKRVRNEYDNTNNDTRLLSMGFGFVEFGSSQSVHDCIKKLQGKTLDGHALELKPSSNNTNNTNKNSITDLFKKSNIDKNPTKLMIRNVPFQASRKEILQLFGSFGQLKKVRLPKKFDGSHRGFAFVEYLTSKEAIAAMKTLSKTHLYGRHLVLEWASAIDDNDNLDELRDKAQRDITSILPQGKKIRFE